MAHKVALFLLGVPVAWLSSREKRLEPEEEWTLVRGPGWEVFIFSSLSQPFRSVSDALVSTSLPITHTDFPWVSWMLHTPPSPDSFYQPLSQGKSLLMDSFPLFLFLFFFPFLHFPRFCTSPPPPPDPRVLHHQGLL